MILHPNAQGDLRPSRVSRRGLLLGAGAASVAASLRHAQAAEPAVDHTIRIGPVSLELAPGKTIKTTGYSDSVPGPVLRLREGRPVNIKVTNDAGYPDLIHWHGLYLPALQDRATEEGSPIIPVGESLIYSFTPRPTGTRWYHSHAMAMTDLARSERNDTTIFAATKVAAGGGHVGSPLEVLRVFLKLEVSCNPSPSTPSLRSEYRPSGSIAEADAIGHG